MRCAQPMRFGATLQDGGALFRLWAPAAQRAELLLHHTGGMNAEYKDKLGKGRLDLERFLKSSTKL